VVPHVQHRPSVVRIANQEAHRTDRVSAFGFFLLIFFWTTFWLGWHMLASKQARSDPRAGIRLLARYLEHDPDLSEVNPLLDCILIIEEVVSAKQT
jgi:hypothetical protein